MPELQAIARYTITAGKEAEVLALLPTFAEVVRSEPGNVSFDIYQQLDEPRNVVLLERYESRQAFADHRETPHFKAYVLDQFVPRLDARTIELFDAEETQ